jgi:hypothetical protein
MACAHDFQVNRVMNAFIKIEPRQADLVIRVPLDLLNGVPFPTGLAANIELWEGDVRLLPTKVTGKLVPLADSSFARLRMSVSSFSSPAPIC